MTLRDAVKDFRNELQEGIAWIIFWKDGRSWHSDYLYYDEDVEMNDLEKLQGISQIDPSAVILNSYYCGHFGEDMPLDELASGVRWHYENNCNLLSDFINTRKQNGGTND